jgi:hypothetical protein
VLNIPINPNIKLSITPGEGGGFLFLEQTLTPGETLMQNCPSGHGLSELQGPPSVISVFWHATPEYPGLQIHFPFEQTPVEVTPKFPKLEAVVQSEEEEHCHPSGGISQFLPLQPFLQRQL